MKFLQEKLSQPVLLIEFFFSDLIKKFSCNQKFKNFALRNSKLFSTKMQVAAAKVEEFPKTQTVFFDNYYANSQVNQKNFQSKVEVLNLRLFDGHNFCLIKLGVAN